MEDLSTNPILAMPSFWVHMVPQPFLKVKVKVVGGPEWIVGGQGSFV